MPDQLNPKDLERLKAELIKYASEGASDDDMREFRASFISELKKKGQPTSSGVSPSETSAPTSGTTSPISPSGNSKATPPLDFTRVTGNIDLNLIKNYEQAQQKRKQIKKESESDPVVKAFSQTGIGKKLNDQSIYDAENSYKLAEPHLDELANRLAKSKKDEFFDSKTKKPNIERISEFSRNFARSYGMDEYGYTYNALKTKLEAKVINQDIESSQDFRVKFNAIYKSKTGKDFTETGKAAESEVGQVLIQKDLIQKDISKASQEKLNAYKDEVFLPKYKSIEHGYNTAVEEIKAQASQDPEAAALHQKIYEDKSNELKSLIDNGDITPEMGANIINSEEFKSQADKTVNEFLQQKYKPAFEGAFKQYSVERTNAINESLKIQNQVNANALSRYQRQMGELKSELDNKLKKLRPEDKVIEDSYKEAFEATLSDRNSNMLQAEKAINAKFGHLFNYGFATSTISSFARMMKSTAEAMDMKDLALQAEILEKDWAGADDPTTEFKDLVDWSKLSKSTGNMLGSMLPSLAVGAAVSYATRGSELPLAAKIAVTGMSGFITETPSIIADAYSSTLARTGLEDKAKEASNRAFQSQVLALPLYMMDGIKFFPSSLKKVPFLGNTLAGRVATGAAGEYTGELMQEGWQGLSERAYMNDKDLSHMFDAGWLDNVSNTALNIAPTIILGGGSPLIQSGLYSINGTLDKRRGKSFASSQNISGLIPEQKSQFFARLALEKSPAFTNTVLSSMLSSGSITQEEFNNIAPFVANIEANSELVMNAKKNGANGSNQLFLASLLAQQNKLQAEVEQDPSLQTQLEELNGRIAEIASGKNEDLYGIIYPDNTSFAFDEKSYKSLMADESFRDNLKNNFAKIVFDFNDKGKRDAAIKSHINDLYNVNIASQPETAPKASAPIDSEKRSQEQADLDKKVKDFQERTGYKPDELSVDWSTGVTLDRLRIGAPVDLVAVSEASDSLYQMYKKYEHMLELDSRLMTTEQIKGLMSELEGYITKLENVKNGKDFDSEVTTEVVENPEQAGPGSDTGSNTVIEAPKAYQDSISSRDVEQGFGEDTVEGFLGSQYYADIIASAKAEGITAAQVIKDLYKQNAFDNLESREDLDAIEVQLKRDLAADKAREVAKDVVEPMDDFIEANYTQIVADLKLANKIKTKGCLY